MAKILFDTSVYIPLFRKGELPGRLLNTSGSTLYLSAVVAEELYAGAGDAWTRKALDQWCQTFQKYGRFLVPTGEDWITCGLTLSHIGRKFGFESIKKGRLVNDVLIALTCQTASTTLLTTNHKDFQIICEFVSFKFMGI